jgi:hypothetical protein
MDMNQSGQQESELEQVVLTQVMRMNVTINGIVAGFLGGCLIMIPTLWLVIKGGEVVGPHLGLLDQFFAGYSVTWFGSVIGFGYGFVVGFATGYFVSFTYNLLVDVRKRWRDRLLVQRQELNARLAQFETMGGNAREPVHTANEPSS